MPVFARHNDETDRSESFRVAGAVAGAVEIRNNAGNAVATFGADP